ncbi:hypothetical protein [Paludibacter jiangxiensis]|uniref:Uncharacterized protein n=1 Tax=Paludibacter jiangxiensis TaxID=681398 RepID=A0A170ZXQ1_9BACT|nr:hypothetical protein [Paludibacter jiangxiensis]GAT63118.1 hypothetical protein PJIAN_3432 [Paludibacter jiangxiensis]
MSIAISTRKASFCDSHTKAAFSEIQEAAFVFSVFRMTTHTIDYSSVTVQY